MGGDKAVGRESWVVGRGSWFPTLFAKGAKRMGHGSVRLVSMSGTGVDARTTTGLHPNEYKSFVGDPGLEPAATKAQRYFVGGVAGLAGPPTSNSRGTRSATGGSAGNGACGSAWYQYAVE